MYFLSHESKKVKRSVLDNAQYFNVYLPCNQLFLVLPLPYFNLDATDYVPEPRHIRKSKKVSCFKTTSRCPYFVVRLR